MFNKSQHVGLDFVIEFFENLPPIPQKLPQNPRFNAFSPWFKIMGLLPHLQNVESSDFAPGSQTGVNGILVWSFHR